MRYFAPFTPALRDYTTKKCACQPRRRYFGRQFSKRKIRVFIFGGYANPSGIYFQKVKHKSAAIPVCTHYPFYVAEKRIGVVHGNRVLTVCADSLVVVLSFSHTERPPVRRKAVLYVFIITIRKRFVKLGSGTLRKEAKRPPPLRRTAKALHTQRAQAKNGRPSRFSPAYVRIRPTSP